MQVLKDNTRVSYDWSYIVAWAGVASSLIAAILLSGAAVCLRSEREKEEQLNLQYLMPGKFYVKFFLFYVSYIKKNLSFLTHFSIPTKTSTISLPTIPSSNLSTAILSWISIRTI